MVIEENNPRKEKLEKTLLLILGYFLAMISFAFLISVNWKLAVGVFIFQWSLNILSPYNK